MRTGDCCSATISTEHTALRYVSVGHICRYRPPKRSHPCHWHLPRPTGCPCDSIRPMWLDDDFLWKEIRFVRNASRLGAPKLVNRNVLFQMLKLWGRSKCIVRRVQFPQNDAGVASNRQFACTQRTPCQASDVFLMAISQDGRVRWISCINSNAVIACGDRQFENFRMPAHVSNGTIFVITFGIEKS